MATFNFSTPASGDNPAFSFSVTGNLASVTQPTSSGTNQTINGYNLASATGTINGKSVSLYTGGISSSNDIKSALLPNSNFNYNNVIKLSPTGDYGSSVLNGLDQNGIALTDGSSVYKLASSFGVFKLQTYTPTSFSATNSSYLAATVTTDAPCYVTGTRLRTDRGEVPVEALAVGDRLVTASGAVRAVIWIGRKTVACDGHPAPEAVLPICVRAGALAPGLPVRDLFLSPEHALHFDGALIPVRCLVNGATILRLAVPSVTYWHVELESHDIVLAEGVEAETYYAADNRHWFEGEVERDEPQASACLPVLVAGERVAAVRRYLWARAQAAGGREIVDPTLQVMADGVALTPHSVSNGRFAYRIPEGTTSLRLRSQAAEPRAVMPDTTDPRRLGVYVVGLTLDGVRVPDDHAVFADGWSFLEGEAPNHGRWTTGDAALPIGGELAFGASFQVQYGLRMPARPSPVVPVAKLGDDANVIRLLPMARAG